jgi:hypothetical protein
VIFSTNAISNKGTVVVKAFATDVTVYAMDGSRRTVDIADWTQVVQDWRSYQPRSQHHFRREWISFIDDDSLLAKEVPEITVCARWTKSRVHETNVDVGKEDCEVET